MHTVNNRLSEIALVDLVKRPIKASPLYDSQKETSLAAFWNMKLLEVFPQ